MAIPRRLMSAGGAFLVGGLLIWAMAWVIDLNVHLQRVAISPGSHTHGGGDFLTRVNLPLTGFPFVVAGMASMAGLERLVADRRASLAFLGGILFAVDGLAHAFAFNDHINQPLSAVLFAVAAPVQILVGVAMPFLPRRLDALWLIGALALLLAYVASRSLSVPALNMPEPVDGLGVFSKILEVLFILVTLTSIFSAAPSGAAVRSPSSTNSGEEAAP